ncbi:MAG: DNA-binding domain-containing protein [Saprospiraceae bacterium]
MSELNTLQKWLTSIIIRPGDLKYKIEVADKKFQLNHTNVIRENDLLTSEEQINIYSRGYVLRLMECMRADYPVLQKHLGSELFETFVKAYLIHHPPESYSLYELGRDFPDFLEASRPDRLDKQIMFDLPVAIARLERARVEVYRSKGTEMTGTNMVSHQPFFLLFQSEKFCITDCLRLLLLPFPLIEFFKIAEKGNQPSIPNARDSYVALSRKNYTVTMHELEAWQWHFLNFLEETTDQSEAVKKTSMTTGIPEETLLAELMLWLPVAIENAYIAIDHGR